MNIPDTSVDCDGCGKELNLLGVHLVVAVKPQRKVLVVEDVAADDNSEAAEQNIYLGNRKGRGVQIRFHDFKCAGKWFSERKDYEPKIQLVVEDEVENDEGGDE